MASWLGFPFTPYLTLSLTLAQPLTLTLALALSRCVVSCVVPRAEGVRSAAHASDGLFLLKADWAEGEGEGERED